MESWFLSDIHLRSNEERNGQILLRFLHSLQQSDPDKTQLFLLGDIFDLWIGGSSFFADKFKPLIDALKTLRERGLRIVYIEGNHDVHIEGFFEKKLGIDVFVEAQYYQINNLTLRLEHGDLINRHDEAYLKYRRLIRNPWLRPLKDIVPGALWDWAGTRASKKSRAQSSHYRVQNEARLIQMIREHAVHVHKTEPPFDVIISGHMHVFDDHKIQIDGKEIRSINLGSWFEDSVRVLKMKGQDFSWVELS